MRLGCSPQLRLALQANTEKLRLEQKQRAARQAADEGSSLEPRWFERVAGARPGEKPTYRYKGGYFESRARGRFDGCRDIFSDERAENGIPSGSPLSGP